MQLTDVLIVFQQLPALVIITKLIRFKGKREADGAGIVFGIHRRHNQVIAAGGGAALHIGDQAGDGVRLEEHHHYGGEDQVILAVKAQAVEVFHRRLQIIQSLGGANTFQIVDAHRIFIPRRHREAVRRQIKAVTPVAAAQIQRPPRRHNRRGMQHLGMGAGQAVFLTKIIRVTLCHDPSFLFRSVSRSTWSNSFPLTNSNAVRSSSRPTTRLLKINSGIAR